ncbi:MAG TPA: hypothetical protein VF503_12120 [Sphingobium sp.]|uniref:hypothetical protein n=1 Tax=Sphingobium sp. TaxID=1912891 RepID=UPI002ED0050F
MNQMRRVASEATSDRPGTRHGTITGFDPDTRAIKAQLEPDGTSTGWIPLKSMWVGNGWGLYLSPSIGDAVEVSFQETDGGVGTAGLLFFNDEDRPLSVPSGEAWLVHKSGASIKLTNDGALSLDDGAGGVIGLMGGNITSSGTWSHSGTFEADGIGLTTHHHTGVQTGPSNTGGPQG